MARSMTPRRRESTESEDEGDRSNKRVKLERTGREPATEEPVDNAMDMDERSDLEDDEKNEQAFLAARARRGRYMGTVSEAGVLKSINLVNFMCHKNLTVQFAPRLNFLVGHNGSGKSAVLTAVAVALGAKAAITGRGQGVKELIMHGADRAIITLTIANKGVDAFEPSRYTDDIIIERIIDRSGSSQYKFRTVRGGNILEKKSIELKNIMNHFNLDIDSPLTLLTQDAAKSFLASTDERKLYSFFLRGTNLQFLADSYSATQATVLKMEREVSTAKQAQPGLEARVKRLGGQMQIARRAGEIRLEHDRARIELAWSYVVQKEKDVEKKTEELADDEEKLRVVKEEIDKHKTKIEKLGQDIMALEGEVNDEVTARAPLRRQVKDAKTALATAQGLVEAMNDQIKDAKNAIDSKKAEIADLTRQINARARDNDSALDPATEKIRDSIKKHEEILQNLTRGLPQREREQSDAMMARDRADEAHRAKVDARQEARASLDRARANLQPFTRATRNGLEKFGNNIGAVMDRIQRTQWRAGPPLGPLGRYVQLEDERYRPVLESYLGGMMCQFAVRCDQDRLTLLRILTECSRSAGYHVPGMQSKFPPVIQWKGDMFDYSRGDLSSRAETVLGKLRFTDEEALRIFINQARIERVLVAPTANAGKDLIDQLLAAGVADSVTVMSADMKNQQGRQNFTQLNPLGHWRGAGLFVKDTEAERRVLEGKVQTAQQEFDAAMRDVDEAVHACKQAEVNLQRANQGVQRCRDGRFKVERELRRLHDELEKSQPITGDALLSTRTEVEVLISEDEKQLADLEGSLKRHMREEKEAAENYQRYKDQLDDTSLNQKKQAVHEMMEQRQNFQRILQAREQSLPRYRDRATQSKAELEKLQGMAQDWAAKAENFGPRVDTQREPKEVQKQSDSLERQLKEAEKQNNNVNLDDLTANYNEALQKLNESRTKINGVQELAAELKKNVFQRQTKWQELRHHVAVRARTAFIANIHKRGFDGRLVFNHENETLSLRVQTTNVGQETQGGASQFTKAPLNLSGGERSYSTVSFLAALWDTSGNTIRCLDEWDVFLDMVNRKIASQLLIDSARESDNKQYIFITPQDMAGMTAKANEKVIRMTDPVRGQQTLPFAPQ